VSEQQPPPQVSPDGTHWWNGQAWVPMPGYEPLPLWRVVLSRIFGVFGHLSELILTMIAMIGLIVLVVLLVQALHSDCVAFC